MDRALALALLALIVVTSGHSAHAESIEAEALFNEGDRLISAGKVEEACTAFEASNRIEARAGTLIRLGQCREQNQQLASAWAAYKDALTRVKDPAKYEFALARSTALEAQLSRLEIKIRASADDITITRNGARLDRGLWNRALPVDGGRYEIVVTAPKFRSWSTTVTVPVSGGNLVVELPALEPLPEPVIARPPPSSSLTTRRRIALGIAGLAGSSLVGGIVLGVSAESRQDQAFGLCPDPRISCDRAAEANELIRSGHRRAIAANVLFGVAGVAVLGAALLWVAGAPASSLAVVPTTDGVAVTGAF